MSQPISLQDFLSSNKSFSKRVPGLQLAWDSTSLGAFKTCPRKYQYSILLGWRHKHEAIPLTFGIHIHKALEIYDKAKALGQSHDSATISALRYCLESTWVRSPATKSAPASGAEWQSHDTYRNRRTLVRSIAWYLEHYKDDPAVTVRLANGQPAVELSFRMDTNRETASGETLVLCGHLDRVVDFAQQVWVMDRKSTKYSLDDRFFAKFSPDNQMSMYSVAGKVVFDQPVRGVIIDGIQVGVGFTRFGRGFAPRFADALDEWYEQLFRWFHMAELYAENQDWPMNDTACGNYGGCVFQSICSRSPKVRDTFLQADFEQVVWDPLTPR